jgi:8-oxo-dGTP diphosphatase
MVDRPNAASVALVDGSRVLLIQRARPPYEGIWTLPGGRIEDGETAEEAAAREVKEELGLDVSDLRFVASTTMIVGPNILAPHGGWKFQLQVFATDAFRGTIIPSAEIADHRWVEAGGTAGLKMTPNLPSVLTEAFRLFGRS